jgi:hypothetical protein
MYEVLTSPITLLCLGVVFLLISLLFFYFKRSVTRLERAQMEQARVLQSFITNMEMSRQQHMVQPPMTQPLHNHVGGVHDNGFVQDSNEQSLIDVSDGSDDDSDDESDDGSDDESDDESDDDSDDESDAETANNENVSSVSNNGMSILEIDELGNSEDDGEREIKVIQLQDNHLEEIHPEIVEVSEMPNTVYDAQYNINIVNNSNSNSDDSDSDSEDEDEDESGSDIGNDSDHNGDIGMNMSNISDNLLNVEEIHSIKKIPSVQELMTSSDVKEEIISTDLKTLTLQKLRQIAIDKDLIQTGSKTNKKELIKMIEEATK